MACIDTLYILTGVIEAVPFNKNVGLKNEQKGAALTPLLCYNL
jgi:hypothetical protein